MNFRKFVILIILVHSQHGYAVSFDTGGTGFSTDELIIERGEVSSMAHISGALIGTLPVLWTPLLNHSGEGYNPIVILFLPEFGLGHVVQGRFKEMGWVFTAAEIGTLMLFAINEHNNYHEINVPLTYGFFRFYEVYDLWCGPIGHNKKFKNLTATAERKTSWNISILPSPHHTGLALHINF